MISLLYSIDCSRTFCEMIDSAILTWIMCEAMGRDILNVILGGAGTVAAPAGEAVEIEGEITTTTIDGVIEALREAKNIIITPGYGLAVAQAQFAIADITKKLKGMGKNVRFGCVIYFFLPFFFMFGSILTIHCLLY